MQEGGQVRVVGVVRLRVISNGHLNMLTWRLGEMLGINFAAEVVRTRTLE